MRWIPTGHSDNRPNKLEQFCENAKCRKCLVGAQNAKRLRSDGEKEWLEWQCWACGYAWATETADAPGKERT